MALPMSCTSPCTVPTMTVPFFSPSPPTRAALQTLVAASMAWAASISSGRKTSPLSKESPIWLMPTTKPSLMISPGAMPAARARVATSSAAAASKLTIASIASWMSSSLLAIACNSSSKVVPSTRAW